MEATITCPICDSTATDVFTTDCKHQFCCTCIVRISKLYGQSLPCPICHNQIYVIENGNKACRPAFHPNNYPKIHNLKDDMLISAYETISKENKWKVLYEYVVDESRGFMTCKDKEIRQLMDKINDNYRPGHSGASIGMTMREMHFIAQYGLEVYHTVTHAIA